MVAPLLLATALSAPQPIVVIDPGHGGSHDGAVGICGLREKDVTLAISRKLADLLRADGRYRRARVVQSGCDPST